MSFLQRIFRRPDYRSDVTQFIDKMKVEKPDLEAQQRLGRSIWWDKHLDREALDEYQAARVAQKPYVYGDDPRHPR
ncbi:DUF3460 family protein [Ramlibacter sp. G-1-2-2]|uniref:DUF3460 family protein n=1 Tax=Ramlibacter agri TaxID=2728837 RepID=A0A848GYQ9_9BURK|nr:DUF3460 family protein [Ramlibacter agri]NML43836.1 DUF3460 family protein [Ramlibacter agri]